MMLLALLVSMASKAQSISGTVTDNLGEPVIGASVVEKGNPQSGAITDIDGKFTIKVNAGTPIIISYIGMVTQEVRAMNGPHTAGCGRHRIWCTEKECGDGIYRKGKCRRPRR